MQKKQNDPWIPSNALEEEVVSLQPRYDFIFGNYLEEQHRYSAPARPKSHLQLVEKLRKKEEQQKELLEPLDTDQREKLSTIIKVQNVINTKPLGEMATIDDWNDGNQCERDTIAMMRRLHFEPSTETPLNSACTIGTVSSAVDYKVLYPNKPGKVNILLGDDFFKFSPALSEREESFVSLNTDSSQQSQSEEASDLIKFSTTESSFNSTDDHLEDIPYECLHNVSNCSAISESSYGYGPTGLHPLSAYIRSTPNQKSRKGKKSKNNKKNSL